MKNHRGTTRVGNRTNDHGHLAFDHDAISTYLAQIKRALGEVENSRAQLNFQINSVEDFQSHLHHLAVMHQKLLDARTAIEQLESHPEIELVYRQAEREELAKLTASLNKYMQDYPSYYEALHQGMVDFKALAKQHLQVIEASRLNHYKTLPTKSQLGIEDNQTLNKEHEDLTLEFERLALMQKGLQAKIESFSMAELDFKEANSQVSQLNDETVALENAIAVMEEKVSAFMQRVELRNDMMKRSKTMNVASKDANTVIEMAATILDELSTKAQRLEDKVNSIATAEKISKDTHSILRKHGHELDAHAEKLGAFESFMRESFPEAHKVVPEANAPAPEGLLPPELAATQPSEPQAPSKQALAGLKDPSQKEAADHIQELRDAKLAAKNAANHAYKAASESDPAVFQQNLKALQNDLGNYAEKRSKLLPRRIANFVLGHGKMSQAKVEAAQTLSNRLAAISLQAEKSGANLKTLKEQTSKAKTEAKRSIEQAEHKRNSAGLSFMKALRGAQNGLLKRMRTESDLDRMISEDSRPAKQFKR